MAEKPATKKGPKSGKKLVKMVVKAADAAVIESVITFKERIELLAELARGVLVQEVEDGEEKVYRTKPDVKALQQLNEMQKGRPAPKATDNTPTDHVPVAIIPGAARKKA